SYQMLTPHPPIINPQKMSSIKNIFLLLLLASLSACTVSTDKLPFPDKLREEIANSIEVPFIYGDTIIYEAPGGICGNSSDDELNRYYDPKLDEQPYYHIFKQKTQKTILLEGDSLNALMARQCKNIADSLSTWDCFSEDKIVLSINGAAETNTSVKIYENFSYNSGRTTIEKLFSFKNGRWGFKVVNKE